MAAAVIASTPAFATDQIMDRLSVGGREVRVIGGFGGIYKGLQDLPAGDCSAAIDGHVATWAVRNGLIFLTGVYADPCSQDPTPVSLEKLFPGTEGPVAATWVTGRWRLLGDPPKDQRGWFPALGPFGEIEVRSGSVVSLKNPPEAQRER